MVFQKFLYIFLLSSEGSICLVVTDMPVWDDHNFALMVVQLQVNYKQDFIPENGKGIELWRKQQVVLEASATRSPHNLALIDGNQKYYSPLLC